MSFVGKPYINSDINPWRPVYPGVGRRNKARVNSVFGALRTVRFHSPGGIFGCIFHGKSGHSCVVIKNIAILIANKVVYLFILLALY